MITRYSKPSRFDNQPYGTIIKVSMDSEEYFVQISKDRDNPNWITLAKFFELAFGKYVHKKDFINKCLLLIEGQELNLKEEILI